MTTESTNPDFETLVLKLETLVIKNRTGGFEDIIEALDGLYECTSNGGLVELGVPEWKITHWYTRFASCLNFYFSNHERNLTGRQLLELVLRKQMVNSIFHASGYRSLSHLHTAMGRRSSIGKYELSADSVAMCLAVISLDDMQPELLNAALQLPPDLFLILTLGWLSERSVLTKNGESNRSKLLLSGPQIEQAKLSEDVLPLVLEAWMQCSYASHPHKHEFKSSLNKLIRNLLNDAGIFHEPVKYSPKQRPRLLVIHESFHSSHVMYRCFSSWIRPLESRFQTISLAYSSDIDNKAEELFDASYRINRDDGLREILKLIRRIEPDVIYFPSIGMRLFVIMLASMRLAPIQIMTLGHPATSCLDTIDYVYLAKIDGEASSVFTEKTLIGSSAAELYVPHPNLPDKPPTPTQASSTTVHIAVNSKLMKLSYRLLEICQRLTQHANVNLNFVFFPGQKNAVLDGVSAEIRSKLPNAKVMPYMSYPELLNELSKCDFSLAAFPFGNANSTVDACLIGIPVVCHFGREPSSQSDKRVLEKTGLGTDLVFDNDEDYFQGALKLVNDFEYRSQVRRKWLEERTNSRAALFSNTGDDDAARMFWFAYSNHDKLMASEQKVFYGDKPLEETA